MTSRWKALGAGVLLAGLTACGQGADAPTTHDEPAGSVQPSSSSATTSDPMGASAPSSSVPGSSSASGASSSAASDAKTPATSQPSVSPTTQTIRVGTTETAGFVTSAGNLMCSISRDSVWCGLGDGSWPTAPTIAAPGGATRVHASGVSMLPDGSVDFSVSAYYEVMSTATASNQPWWKPSMGSVHSDAAGGADLAILPKGTTITNGSFSCTRTVGFECTSPSGKRIHVTSKGVTTN